MEIKFYSIVILLSLSRLTSSVLWNDDKAVVASDDNIVGLDDSGKDQSAQDIRNVDETVYTGVSVANKNGRESKAPFLLSLSRLTSSVLWNDDKAVVAKVTNLEYLIISILDL